MYSLIKKALFQLDPETAHTAVTRLAKVVPSALLRVAMPPPKKIRTQFAGVTLASPIGLSAGFDKNGEVIDFMGALGFGFVEIGSVTLKPCVGNPKPRIFRLPRDESLINRMGLPNHGASAIVARLQKTSPRTPYGINIAKTPDAKDGIEDIMACLEIMHPFGFYTVFNLSCPNTADGKTFENPAQFEPLARSIDAFRKAKKSTRPYLIKISPDISRAVLQKIVELAGKYSFDGFVISNTTLARKGLETDEREMRRIGQGGISGRALFDPANRVQSQVFEMVGRDKIIIASGGILTADDAIRKMDLGARLVQIYTGLIYRGPLIVRAINHRLSRTS